MTDKTTETPMDSWAMACSILVGTRQAIALASTEHASIVAVNPHKTFIAEASSVAATISLLREIERTLDYELARTARSSNLPMPERA